MSKTHCLRFGLHTESIACLQSKVALGKLATKFKSANSCGNRWFFHVGNLVLYACLNFLWVPIKVVVSKMGACFIWCLFSVSDDILPNYTKWVSNSPLWYVHSKYQMLVFINSYNGTFVFYHHLICNALYW